MNIKTFCFSVANALIGLCGIANVALGTYFMFQQSTQSGLAAMGAGVVLVFAASIERFESLKGLGLEAKTRELSSKIAEAEVTLEKLRTLAELSSRSTVRAESAFGRNGIAPSTQESYEVVCKVRALLGQVGSESMVIREVLEPWALTQAFDLLHWLKKKWIIEIVTDRPGPESDLDRALNLSFTDLHEKLRTVDDAVDFLSKIQELAGGYPERVRTSIQASCKEWMIRLQYLAAHQDLSDKTAWFGIR